METERFRRALSGDTCRLFLVLLQRIAKLLPLIEASEQRPDAIDSVLPQLHRHLGGRGFARTGAVKDYVAVARDLAAALVLAHPNDPHGTSLVALTKSLVEQTEIIREKMLPYIDGVECWHSRNTAETTNHYVAFAKEHGLIMTGGSDCHQKPIIMGTVQVPDWVANQFA